MNEKKISIYTPRNQDKNNLILAPRRLIYTTLPCIDRRSLTPMAKLLKRTWEQLVRM